MAERITGHTELIGLIATPIRHSMSPTMHNEAFAHLGLDYVYLAFEVGNQELKDVVQGFRALKLRGFNVSMPNKTEICQYLDKLSPAAQLVGAVNTVVNDDGVPVPPKDYSSVRDSENVLAPLCWLLGLEEDAFHTHAPAKEEG